MMMSANSVEPIPEADPNQSIWRYMSLVQFVSMLHSSALYFANAGEIARRDDHLEGAVPPKSLLRFDAVHPGTGTSLIDTVERQKSLIYISCWCAHDCESVGMWDRYAKGPCGVAVKSTVGRLRGSLPMDEARRIHIKNIIYIDHDVEDYGARNTYELYFFKDKYWEEEHEVRAQFSHSNLQYLKGYKVEDYRHGDPLPVDLELLIESACVAPSSQAFELEVVQSLLDKYGVPRTAERSYIRRGGAA
jgi:hypothetical protein